MKREPAAMEPSAIDNWRRLDALTTTSGQPSEAQPVGLAALGVRHIINLGLHSHERAQPDDASSVRALGMHYTHLPVAFDAPRKADFAAFCDVIANAGDAPVHHCIANWRVSAFFFRYRRDVLGWDEAEARADLEAVWTRNALWAASIGRTCAGASMPVVGRSS